ncbi:MAG: TlpA family protein disulfide reductase [Planctomycetes bacterium]|nr:TlpA family protein disulfide reductase [Planctomycetota bacterium]
MRRVVATALILTMSVVTAEAQDGKTPKEINATGWINSEGVSLEKLKGKVVVVEFWATWCPPCRASIPHLVELRNKLDKSKVEIIGLSDESKEKVEPFAKDFKMNYTVGYGSTSGRAYGVNGIPHAFIIGPDGLIKWDGHPMDDAFASTLTKLAETAKAMPAASPEPKIALGEALAAAAKAGGVPAELRVAWSRTDAGKKAPRELTLTGAEFELRSEKDERKKGKVEDKEIAELLKAFAEAQVATKESKAPTKATVKLIVSLGGEARELTFDPAKGYGPFSKALKAVEDLHSKYAK